MKRFFDLKLLYQVALSISISSILLSMAIGLVLIYNSSLHVTEEVKSKYEYLISDYTHQLDIRIAESEAVVSNLGTQLSLDRELTSVFDTDLGESMFFEKYQNNIDAVGEYQDYTYDIFVYL